MAMEQWNVTFDENKASVPQTEASDGKILGYIGIGLKLVLNPTLGTAGVCVNLINAAVFLKQGLLDGVTINFFILSISDGLFAVASVVGSTGFIVEFILKTHDGLGGSVIDAQLVYWGALFAAPITQTISVIVTVVIAVVRCFSVVMPLKVKSILTTKRQVAAILVLSAIPTSVYFWAFNPLRPLYVSNPQTNVTVAAYFVGAHWAAYIVVRNTTFFGGFVIIGVCSVVLSVSLKRSSKFREASSSGKEKTGSDPERKSKDKRRDARVVQMVMMVSAAYIVCSLIPFIYLVLFLTLFGMGSSYGNLNDFLLTLSESGILTNGIVNIFIYYFYSSRYRITLLAMVGVDKDTRPS